jgi:hypothetical protein
VERVRQKIRRKEASSSYQALLVEKIRDPEASWTESKPILERDPQKRASNPDLEPADKEKLFRDHVKSLYEVRVLLNCNPYQIKFSAFSATRSEQNLVSRTFSAYLLVG